MKREFLFDVIDFKSLSDLLRGGISGYSVAGSVGGRLGSIYLLLHDGSALHIQSKMNDVASWHEVGTLVFEWRSSTANSFPATLPLDATWSSIGMIAKLCLDEDAFTAESGLAIQNRAGARILILSGAFPNTVEIEAPFYAGDFQPEYDVGEYKRTLLD